MKRQFLCLGTILTIGFAGLALPSSADNTGAAQERRDERTIRLAAWNLSNLHHEPGQSVPGRDVVRSREDYKWLRYYADRLDADVIAIQEANSRAAIHSVFFAGRYTAYISGRRAQDLDTYDLTGDWPDAGIYTGFAVRKGITVTRVESVPALEILHADPDDGTRRPTRWAVELEIEHQGQPFVILSVHLKSGCAVGPLRDADRSYDTYVAEDPDCTTLARQVAPLRAWIDRRMAAGIPFAIVGDFNRAFDATGPQGHLWQGMTQDLPDGGNLTRFPDGMTAECWKNAPPARYYTNPIDFIVLDDQARAMARPRSFRWVTFDKALAARADLISDHCPLSLDLTFPDRDGAAASLVILNNPQDAVSGPHHLHSEHDMSLDEPVAATVPAVRPQP